MNIKELKELIKDLPDEMEIILQKDAEGNGYSPLRGGDFEALYVPRNTWSGEVYNLDGGTEESGMEEEEWEETVKNHPPVLVLFPIN